MKLKIHIRYLGTNYCGYQVQPGKETVQKKLNEAAKQLFGFDCDIVGCSRTDSGVHANEFVATVSKKGTDELSTTVPVEKVPQAFTVYLPEDISVFDAAWVESKFHPRYDVREKEYLYRIYNCPVRDPFWVGRAFSVPHRLSDADLERMNRAANDLIGTQDFASYMAQGSKVTDTVRTVSQAVFTREGDLITFRIRANGFLYNMVRIIVGTLLDVGAGRREPDEIAHITESKNRAEAGMTAPACGLYLNRVFYD